MTTKIRQQMLDLPCFKEECIDAGVIVNRYIDSGYSYASTSKSGGHYANYPTEYYFVIEGEKDGVTVRYKFEVTAEEYEKYRIGDYYER